MLRAAVAGDVPRLLAIRAAAWKDALSDPAAVTETMLRALVAGGAVTVWDEAGDVVGFAAVDGGEIHLLVDGTQRSRGIGRALLAAACDAVKDAGHEAALVTLGPGGGAERHYRAAGWRDAGQSPAGGAVLKKPF